MRFSCGWSLLWLFPFAVFGFVDKSRTPIKHQQSIQTTSFWQLTSGRLTQSTSKHEDNSLLPPPSTEFEFDVPSTNDGGGGGDSVVSQVCDVLLDLGASSVQVDLMDQLIETNDYFDRTGQVENLSSSQVVFSASHIEEARSLVMQVCTILQLDCGGYDQVVRTRQVRQTMLDMQSNVNHHDSKLKIAKSNMTLSLLSQTDEENTSSAPKSSSLWAFGDGNHPSTRLIIKALESDALSAIILPRNKKRDLSFLDYGCGTGVLSLVAYAIYCPKKMTAVDISLDALALTRQNWARNFPNEMERGALDSAIEIVHADVFDSSKMYDVIMANIPSKTLITLLPLLVPRFSSLENNNNNDAVLILSGYPSSEATQVTKAASSFGLREVLRDYEAGWIAQTFVCSRKK